ncbi:MAG: TetR/AcrR family transcriptional regulator [Bacteroidota bacterium]
MTDTQKTKKEYILEAAAGLFHENGYKATSMRGLAERVGLRQASSLYSHYSSKEEMLRDICFNNAHKFLDGLVAICQQGQGPIDQLRALIRLHISIATEDATSIIVFNDEWRHLSSEPLTEFLDLRKEYESKVRHIIQEGIDQGQLRRIDPSTVLYTILAALRWLHYRPRKIVETKDKNVLQEEMEILLLSGLKEEAVSTPSLASSQK